MSGTLRDLLFVSKSRCFACKNHSRGLGPMETSISDARQAVLHPENHRWVLRPIETCNLGPKVSGLQAKTSDEKLVIHVIKSMFCMHKTTGEGWNPYSLFILVLITLLCLLKITDEVWDPYRLLSLVIKSLFCMKKNTDEGWNPYKLDILVQITPFCKHKLTGYVWDS